FLIRDHLWFFAAYNRVDFRGDVSRVESTRDVSSEDRFPFETAENLYSGKLTWNLASSTTVVGTVFADPSTSAGASGADPRQGLGAAYVQPIVSPEPSTWFSARNQGGTDYGVRVNHLIGSRALATIQGSYHKDQNGLTAPDGIRFVDWTCAGGTPDDPCLIPSEPKFISGGYGLISSLEDTTRPRPAPFPAGAPPPSWGPPFQTGGGHL